MARASGDKRQRTAPAPDPELPPSGPERVFAARVTPPEPPRPLPAGRRAIFFDIENTSRPEHIVRMLEHLEIDRRDRRTEFVAVGNWRVIGSDTARMLARHGAYLLHSAPSTGVRDWSDLRIAVSAGVWLAGGRPGDVVEIVSDDRAFDAIGDVAAGLGISFRRLSFRALSGAPARAAHDGQEPPEPRARRGRRGRRRGRRDESPSHAAHVEAPRARQPDSDSTDAHSAPQDAIVELVRELVQRSGGEGVLIDTLANALKARGFRRPPGSPRLITRLRRIKELSVSPRGMISLVAAAAEPRLADTEVVEAAMSNAGQEAYAQAPEADKTPPPTAGRRRRSRRGGRRHRRKEPTSAPTA